MGGQLAHVYRFRQLVMSAKNSKPCGPSGLPMKIAPICDPALTPTKCSAFISLDQAIVLYVRYPHLIR